ncbi:hypothetical protein FGO68_gene7189 [Halteria grandinella]|uniref:Uncharacterized protein n=1 Tax=Halteria grandinella TaxID=5974 RepID=A0A8J8T749_HALGN|nr:hypothetical protein FGO68_gene7189 [Halteria grandinella]
MLLPICRKPQHHHPLHLFLQSSKPVCFYCTLIPEECLFINVPACRSFNRCSLHFSDSLIPYFKIVPLSKLGCPRANQHVILAVNLFEVSHLARVHSHLTFQGLLFLGSLVKIPRMLLLLGGWLIW